jgi:hypothetical protein
LEVLPGGAYRPLIDTKEYGVLIVNLREMLQDERETCGEFNRHAYYVELRGNELSQMFRGYLCARAHISFFHVAAPSNTEEMEPGNIEQMSESDRDASHVFLLNQDDNSWRFALSGTDLTTMRQSRKLNIENPKGPRFVAEAGVWLMTGECVLKDRP